MPKTITKTVYTFGELLNAHKSNPKEVTTRAIDKAREWITEGLQGFDWWDSTYETWTDALAQIGFDDAKIQFSGFCSQGDGASFECSSVDTAKLIDFMTQDIKPSEVIAPTTDGEDFKPWLVWKASGKTPVNPKYKRLKRIITANVERISRSYSHENTCTFRAELDTSRRSKVDRLERLVTGFEKDVEHLRRDLSRAIYRDLESEYEYMTSDEQLIEDSDANDWTFSADGRRDG